ncbi:hypothetical protein ACE6H2_011581 [Prunus campanulata]
MNEKSDPTMVAYSCTSTSMWGLEQAIRKQFWKDTNELASYEYIAEILFQFYVAYIKIKATLIGSSAKEHPEDVSKQDTDINKQCVLDYRNEFITNELRTPSMGESEDA